VFVLILLASIVSVWTGEQRNDNGGDILHELMDRTEADDRHLEPGGRK
jgi:hypothetical protein